MLTIPGPSGIIEGRVDSAGHESATRWALLAHPHPQHGGSLHDGVLETAAGALLGADYAVLRFNFRGVGGSAGRYDGGAGETDDLVAVYAWLTEHYPVDCVILGGYSFGAAVAWQSLERLTPARVLLIAPPIGAMPFALRTTLAAPVAVIAGDRDAFVQRQALDEFARCHGAAITSIAGADHFFTGAHGALEDAIRQVI